MPPIYFEKQTHTKGRRKGYATHIDLIGVTKQEATSLIINH